MKKRKKSKEENQKASRMCDAIQLETEPKPTEIFLGSIKTKKPKFKANIEPRNRKTVRDRVKEEINKKRQQDVSGNFLVSFK